MDSLNTILNSGTYGENVSRHNDNNSKIKQAITTLENVAIANKGYFDTLASLQAAFPSPKAGNIAYVANVASSTGYYIYNAVAGVWTATTTEAPAVGVEISNYAQHGYSSSPKTLKQVDDEVVQLADKTLNIHPLNLWNWGRFESSPFLHSPTLNPNYNYTGGIFNIDKEITIDFPVSEFRGKRIYFGLTTDFATVTAASKYGYFFNAGTPIWSPGPTYNVGPADGNGFKVVKIDHGTIVPATATHIRFIFNEIGKKVKEVYAGETPYTGITNYKVSEEKNYKWFGINQDKIITDVLYLNKGKFTHNPNGTTLIDANGNAAIDLSLRLYDDNLWGKKGFMNLNVDYAGSRAVKMLVYAYKFTSPSTLDLKWSSGFNLVNGEITVPFDFSNPEINFARLVLMTYDLTPITIKSLNFGDIFFTSKDKKIYDNADVMLLQSKEYTDEVSAGKAPVTHTHTKSQITDFAHTHPVGEITGLSLTSWSPVYSFVPYSTGYVRKLTDYVGGSGDKPTQYLNQYLKADGTHTSAIVEAYLINNDLANYIQKSELSSKDNTSLSNAIDVFSSGTGVNSELVNQDIRASLLKSLCYIGVKATGNHTTLKVISRSKNKFDASKITRRKLMGGTGSLAVSENFNVTDYIYLKAGDYYVSGLTNSKLSGNNDYFVVFNKEKTFNQNVALDISANRVFAMPIDGYLVTSVHNKDLNSFQLESSSVTNHETGVSSELSINLGRYNSLNPFVLRKSGAIYDEIINVNGKYIRVQRVAEDGGILTSPLYASEGEYGFNVEGSLFADNDSEFVVISDVVPEISVIYQLGYEAKLSGIIDEISSLKSIKQNYDNVQVVEKLGDVHAGGSYYSAFASGVIYKGKEIHVVRNSNEHGTSAANYNKLVAYIRENDGSFTPKIINVDYTKGDHRDPNLTVDKTGTKLMLTTTTYDMTTYRVWLYFLDDSLDVVGSPILIVENMFGWGNCLITPAGKLLKCAYNPVAGLNGGVALYRSSGDVNAPGTFTKITDLFPAITDNLNECTIAYWGDKLVAIARANIGNGATTSTTNLEGDSGWSAMQRLPFIVHAPTLQPYNSRYEPLVSCISTFEDGQPMLSYRRPAFVATSDFAIWTEKQYLVPSVIHAGGYPSMVRRGIGYGVMWYEDGIYATPMTNVYYHDVDIYKAVPNYSNLMTI